MAESQSLVVVVYFRRQNGLRFSQVCQVHPLRLQPDLFREMIFCFILNLFVGNSELYLFIGR